MGLWGRGVAPGRPWKLSSVKDFIPPPHIPAPKEQQPFRGGSLRHCSAQLAALGESAVESWASGQSRPREGEKWSSTLTAHCATGSGGNSLFTINSFKKSSLASLFPITLFPSPGTTCDTSFLFILQGKLYISMCKSTTYVFLFCMAGFYRIYCFAPCSSVSVSGRLFCISTVKALSFLDGRIII